jgi:hypothetical protein
MDWSSDVNLQERFKEWKDLVADEFCLLNLIEPAEKVYCEAVRVWCGKYGQKILLEHINEITADKEEPTEAENKAARLMAINHINLLGKFLEPRGAHFVGWDRIHKLKEGPEGISGYIEKIREAVKPLDFWKSLYRKGIHLPIGEWPG